MPEHQPSRREVIRSATVAAAGAAAGIGAGRAATRRVSTDPVPRRPMGRTGVEVSVMGLGGYTLGDASSLDEAKRIVAEAIDAGVNFFDNAWEYHDGKSEQWLGQCLQGQRDKVIVMTKVCTHGRDKAVAMKQLEESLKRLGTDHLDVWQIHECVYYNDPERHFAPGGVVEALAEAKKQGKVRFVGFTGHKDPRIHLKMLGHDFAWDTVQMPLNCFDASYRSFEKQVLPEAVKRGVAVLGMKSLCGGGPPLWDSPVAVEEMLRYAMSVPGIATTISGVDSLEVLRQNLAVARGFTAMSAAEMDSMRQRAAAAAGDGHLELYKSTMKFDGKVGREQHGFPPAEKLPL